MPGFCLDSEKFHLALFMDMKPLINHSGSVHRIMVVASIGKEAQGLMTYPGTLRLMACVMVGFWGGKFLTIFDGASLLHPLFLHLQFCLPTLHWFGEGGGGKGVGGWLVSCIVELIALLRCVVKIIVTFFCEKFGGHLYSFGFY